MKNVTRRQLFGLGIGGIVTALGVALAEPLRLAFSATESAKVTEAVRDPDVVSSRLALGGVQHA